MAKVLILALIVAIGVDNIGAMPRQNLRQRKLSNDLEARAAVASTDYESDEDSVGGGSKGSAVARPKAKRDNSGSGDFESIPIPGMRDSQA
uniref:Hirudin n=1 Tax=Rhipicephalus appendiculatus TaxID=34631 RepID=A0A131YEB6_RHIAP